MYILGNSINLQRRKKQYFIALKVSGFVRVLLFSKIIVQSSPQLRSVVDDLEYVMQHLIL